MFWVAGSNLTDASLKLDANGTFTDTLTNDKKIQPLLLLVKEGAHKTIRAFVSSSSTIHFFKDKNGTLDYDFDKDDYLNNFTKIFHKKIALFFNNEHTAENFKAVEESILDSYHKI